MSLQWAEIQGWVPLIYFAQISYLSVHLNVRILQHSLLTEYFFKKKSVCVIKELPRQTESVTEP